MFVRCLAAAVALLPLSALADETPAIQAEAANCEVYVDEVLFAKQGVYGSYSEYFLFQLKTRAEDNVQNLGMFARYQENGAAREEIILSPKLEGRLLPHLTFTVVSKNGNTVNPQRTLERFAFFVDVGTEPASMKRLWLKDGWHDFSADALSRERYNYSFPQGWGYGVVEYLWRDSGSPIFAQRTKCAR